MVTSDDISSTSALIVQSQDDRGVIVLIVMGHICFSVVFVWPTPRCYSV